MNKHSSELESVAIILPTRRSAWELEEKLKKSSIEESPNIQAIEDFVQQVSGFRKINPVLLLLEVFEIFQKIDDKIKLEKFTGWGGILLKDFDLIDRNLVSAPQLFQNLCDIKNIE
ncbi:MAG: PD-(D/E)XK nuclease family protein, partial [Bacteroidota bacterium]